jgi:hypothetical protein
MKAETPAGDDAGMRQLIAEADAQFHRAIRELNGAITRLEERGDHSRDIIEAVRGLGKALTVAFEERARVERLRRQDGSAGEAGPAIDYDAARDEIGRRLARLRAEHGG